MNSSEYSELFKFVQHQCERYNIDDSHGLIHSKRCVSWVKKMIEYDDTNDENDSKLSNEEKTIAIYSAALHDLCDKKYTPTFESVTELREWLSSKDILNCDMVEAILDIIQTMSYSFLNQRKYNDGKPWYPDHKWIRSYHLARNADLLEGYHVGRCYLYTKHAYSQYDENEIWRRVEDLFRVRMYKYLSDGWITHPFAISIVDVLDKEAKLCFKTRVWEYNI